MRLLIITQKVDKNDPILGFFHRWIVEFSKNCESVTIICLEKGVNELPKNTKVLSLGKEEGVSRLKYLSRFYSYIWRERKNYDAVFVHMNPIYVILGGLIWRMLGKKISLWYTHKNVDSKLRLAEKLTHQIFTASKESFRLTSKKVQVMGHGIDVEELSKFIRVPNNAFTIISVGRITRIKNLDILIETASILKSEGLDFICEIIGPQVTQDDSIYLEELLVMVRNKNLGKEVIFRGAVANDKIGEFYARSNLNINLTPTGGIDKVVLEGMAGGAIPIVSNKAFASIFGSYADQLIFEERNSQSLAEKIIPFYVGANTQMIREVLFKKIETDFDLKRLVNKIVTYMVG